MLDPREKKIVVVGGAAAALILLITFVAFPAAGRYRSLSKASAAAERDLAELRRMRPELEGLDREVRARAGRVTAAANEAASPLARLQGSVQSLGIASSAVSVKSAGTKEVEFYAEEAFDVRVDNMTYLEAVQLLTKLEDGPLPVAIRSVRLKSRFDDGRYVDATIRLGYLRPAATK